MDGWMNGARAPHAPLKPSLFKPKPRIESSVEVEKVENTTRTGRTKRRRLQMREEGEKCGALAVK